MKKKIKELLKASGAVLLNYVTYRSDMGCQVYNINVKNGDEVYSFDDSYFIGSGVGADYILQSFKKEVIEGFLV